ncbi:MAG: hypothetical protein Q7R95_05425, partial [bacterium]|nr:hypothetical protein [bacterium]
ALLNDEIGALYKYDGTINIKLNKEKLVYNVLPIPSFNSPYFLDNIYPKTSQGGDTDSYFSKGFIYTNGTPSDVTSFLNSFINAVPNNYFYSLTNTKYILFKTTQLFSEQSKVSFTNEWINWKRAIGQKGLYKIPSQFFLPKLFSTYNFQIISQSISSLPNLIKLNIPFKKNVFFFRNQNSSSGLSLLRNASLDKDKYKLPIIEFKKINPTKYRIVVHGAKGEFPIVFSESFHEGWKTYLASPDNLKFKISNLKSIFNDQIIKYKILDGNTEDQASREELKSFIDNGWITSLGDGKEKEITHQKWADNKEKLDYVEKYNIDFISKNLQDTIQNDNLPSGPFYETWFKKPVEDNKNHLMVNGYANSWLIDTEKICGKSVVGTTVHRPPSTVCIKNPDGSYDFEMVVEFYPQRLFYIGLFVSGTTFISCLLYLAWARIRKENLFI